jgi:hypothetical protein
MKLSYIWGYISVKKNIFFVLCIILVFCLPHAQTVSPRRSTTRSFPRGMRSGRSRTASK